MKVSKRKSIIVATIIVIVLLVLSVYYLLLIRKESMDNSASASDERTLKTVNVVAMDGKFEPSDLVTELFGDVDLVVTAKDRDYEFKIKGYPRLDTTIKKGETQTINLYSLGVGEYSYTCGTGCSGNITINQQPDDDE